MRDKINQAFPQYSGNGCLEVSISEIFYIIDEVEKKCRITVPGEQAFDFTVLNPAHKEICFLTIDKCLFNDSTHKKCDFAVFDNLTFCFVEIKDTFNRSTGHKTKAKDQLRTTIEIFKSLLSFDGFAVEAIISWRYRPIRPAASTRMQEAAVEFNDDLNVTLLEGNLKEFL